MSIFMSLSFLGLLVTVSIRIVADFGAQIFQFAMKLKRAKTLEITTISAIIFIHCYMPCLLISQKNISLEISFIFGNLIS